MQLRSGRRLELEAALLAGTIDLAIMAVDESDPSFVAHELLQVPIVLLVPSACRLTSAAEFLAQRPLPYGLVFPPSAEGATRI